MPSHIFTRLGLWDESIASNLAARKAAHEQGDVGEELHAMDYLVYAYLQLGRDEDVDRELQRLRMMKNLHAGDFKVGYASTAMPVRSAIERQDWAAAARVEPGPGSPPHVAAIAVWAKALGKARGAVPSDVESEISLLAGEQGELSRAGNAYWAAQTEVLRTEVVAWAAQAHGNTQEAEVRMRAAADGEDAMEKLPVTPGPIVPAREQLGELLILQNRRQEAAEAFRAVLVDAPGRKGALAGLSRATR